MFHLNVDGSRNTISSNDIRVSLKGMEKNERNYFFWVSPAFTLIFSITKPGLLHQSDQLKYESLFHLSFNISSSPMSTSV